MTSASVNPKSQNLAVVKWFDDQIVSRLEHLNTVVGVLELRHQNHRDVPHLLGLPQLFEELEGIGIREVGIQQDEVRLAGGYLVKGF